MPNTDITKCANGDECLRKDTCWRHLCPPEMLQSYSDFFKGDGELCLHYYACNGFKGVDENDDK